MTINNVISSSFYFELKEKEFLGFANLEEICNFARRLLSKGLKNTPLQRFTLSWGPRENGKGSIREKASFRVHGCACFWPSGRA